MRGTGCAGCGLTKKRPGIWAFELYSMYGLLRMGKAPEADKGLSG